MTVFNVGLYLMFDVNSVTFKKASNSDYDSRVDCCVMDLQMSIIADLNPLKNTFDLQDQPTVTQILNAQIGDETPLFTRMNTVKNNDYL